MLKLIVLAALLSALGGCAVWRPTPAPMRTLTLTAQCATKPATLVVFLPGSFSLPEDLVDHGFVRALRERHVAADIWLVDAHLGYYSEHSILDRLDADVFARARAAGYRSLWLVGVSVGGYGAFLRAASSQEDSGIDGIVAIAPYLGARQVGAAIEAAGGLAAWPAPPRRAITRQMEPVDADESVWGWLQGHAAGRSRPELFLGFGLSDRFVFSDRLLAASLPADRVFTAPGGHDWPVWEALWQRMLPTLPLPTDPSCREGPG